jgi:hypothetical protein
LVEDFLGWAVAEVFFAFPVIEAVADVGIEAFGPLGCRCL